MDVKQYYQKIREVEASLTDTYPVVVSVETSDGGKAGILSEVSQAVAAKMIVEGCAVLAKPAERELYFEQQTVARRQAEQAELARRLQVTVVSEPDAKTTIGLRKSNEPAGQ